MRELFPDYYYPTEEEFKTAWEKATFVLDTSVLLDLYRYPEELREQLINIFEKIADRLWIPYQVALEFQRRRMTTISDQKLTFNKVENIIQKGIDEIQKIQKGINKQLNDFQLEKRHSTISVNEFLKKMAESIQLIEQDSQEFLSELKQKKDKQLSVTTNPDPIRNKIDELIRNKIGNPPSDQETIDKIYDECRHRIEHSIPPGLIDYNEKQGDDETFTYQDIKYNRKYGDIVIWLNIIEKVKEKGYVIFITSEKKDDWWWSFKQSSEPPQKMGLRRELLEEIKVKTNDGFFWAYQTERFMKYADEYLNVDVEQKLIDQIYDISSVGQNLSDNLSYEDIDIQVITSEDLSNTIKCDFLQVFSQSNQQQYDAYAEISFWEINGWRVNGVRVDPSTYKSLTHPALGTWNIISWQENEPYGLYKGEIRANNPVCMRCFLVKKSK
ncbi:PIN-like domain-containing protein [Desmonostoc muscorum LEGE 12446]|uniref:PIN like domain-containing protein n=1 Tax=Desmonostoc muscorum LEGE 12446 TaxID=1828758 RepID=A0A8J7A4P5_DESMC|nr:PIN-like domain-containing protein [Desmonostoc muscorum]MCF2152335.1 PIN-like domain-containing protein [Desmonostoc muscorum LEGE 12446]